MALYMVGTPMKSVGLYLLMAFSRASMSLGLVTKIMAAERDHAQAMTATIPKTWKRGMAARWISSGIFTSGRKAEAWSALATRLRWRITAALGTPVVPPVYWKRAMSSGPTSTFGSSAGYLSRRSGSHRSPSASSTRCPSFFSMRSPKRSLSRPARCSLMLLTITFWTLVLGWTCLTTG